MIPPNKCNLFSLYVNVVLMYIFSNYTESFGIKGWNNICETLKKNPQEKERVNK